MKKTNTFLSRINSISYRVEKAKNLSCDLFEKTLDYQLYKTYSNLWELRLSLYDYIYTNIRK